MRKRRHYKAVLLDFGDDHSGMGKPLSEDLRKRIVAKRDEGHTAAEVSQMFRVSMRSINRFCARMRSQGNLSHDKLGKPPGSQLDLHQEEISKWIAEGPSLTLEEIAARCETQFGLSIHHTTVMRALAKWGFRYKKNDVRQRAEPS
ncbi:MAG: winged helix-turn-helix domain-containing protein [Akkermansiaceae bacterium]